MPRRRASCCSAGPVRSGWPSCPRWRPRPAPRGCWRGGAEARLAEAARALPYRVTTLRYDATDVAGHESFAERVFAAGPVDLVVSAAGILTPQAELEQDVERAAEMIGTNFTGHVTTLLAVARQ